MKALPTSETSVTLFHWTFCDILICFGSF